MFVIKYVSSRDTLRMMNCNICTKISEFRCRKCLITTYCSSECAMKDWTEFHSFQCIGVNDNKREREDPPEPQDCFNEDDPISLEKISDLEPENIFTLMVGNKKYCFSLDALVQWV